MDAYAMIARGYDVWSRYNTKSTETRNIASYNEKIDRIVHLLYSDDPKWQTFFKNYPNLKTHRNKSVTKLRGMANNLATIEMVSKVLKILAGGVGIATGGTIIVSLLFPPKPPQLLPDWLGGEYVSALLPAVFQPATPTASPLAVAGAVAVFCRAVLDIGASISQLVLTQKKLDEVNQIIEDDRKLLEQLGVFEFLDKLNDALDDLFGTSTSSRILSDFIEFLKPFQPNLNEIESFLLRPLLLCMMVSSFISNILLVVPPLAAIMMSIIFIRRQGCTNVSSRIALGFARAGSASVEISRLIAATFLKDCKFGELIPRNLAGKLAVGSMAFVRIVVDIISVVRYSIDLTKRSQSDKVTRIYKVADELETNLKSYHSVNDELRKCLMLRLNMTDLSMWEPLPNNTLDQSSSGTTIKKHLLTLLLNFFGNISYA